MPCQFLSSAEAVTHYVSPGATVAIGGMHMTSVPMSLVRELLRQQIRIGRLLTGPSASLQAELPLGAGLVGEIMSPYVGFEHLGLAPAFRRAVEGGQVRVLECDEGNMTHAFYAGAGGLPFIPCPPGIDLTDIPGVNPEFYRQVTDPFTGQTCWVVHPLRPDVMLLHCLEADADGNVAFGGYLFTDRLMALASKRLIVQVERIVPREKLAAHKPGTTLPGFLVSAVVVAPGGCHPTASPGAYSRDEADIRAYLQAAKDPADVQEYVHRTIRSVPEPDYLQAAGRRLALAGAAEEGKP